ncbi:MAG: aryl-sulfate sulfotransferase, partial [Candidatus Hydrogenedentes bacterium]|nr:aryl-sulfate sulfotransferase [Candidatus Hydrogenedentota bacterium]
MRSNKVPRNLSLILLVLILQSGCHQSAPPALPQAADETSAYTLLSTVGSPDAYLLDKQGRIVHQWETNSLPGQTAYLLENGHLLKTGSKNMQGNGVFSGGGAGGVVEEYDWDGQRVWRFEYDSDAHLLHHGLTPLPNGNVLMIAWERKSREEAIAAGRDPSLVGDQGMWPDHIIEVEPSRPEGGRIVWEWHVWDHLIQEIDPALPNYGKVAEHPERIHVNPPNWVASLSDAQREELGALGDLTAAREPERRNVHPDWNHINAVAYNAELDQIALSVLGLNELWIIDHSTTTEEAKRSTGGRYGKGGDLLYRWG